MNSSLLNRTIARSTKTIERTAAVIMGVADGMEPPMKAFVEYSGSLSGSTKATEELRDPKSDGINCCRNTKTRGTPMTALRLLKNVPSMMDMQSQKARPNP